MIYENITEVYQLENDERFRKENPHFFDRDTLKFFGERKSEMRVHKTKAIVKDYYGKEHKCYVLTSVQHKAPQGIPKIRYYYFDVETLDMISN